MFRRVFLFALYATLPLLGSSSPPLSAQQQPGRNQGTPSLAQRATQGRIESSASWAVETAPNRYELWASGSAQVVLSDVGFLSIDLVGYAVKDRLRLDRPAALGQSTAFPRVRLSGDGALYRISVAGETALLLVRSDAAPLVLFSVPDGPSGPSLLEAVHLSPDESLACWASSLESGGDVFVLDFANGNQVTCATEALSPLAIEPDSLRISTGGLWFVAEEELYRSDRVLGTAPSVVTLGTEPVHPELALARQADSVVAALEEQKDGERMLFAVPRSGPAIALHTKFEEYDTPNYDHPLGPWLAFSPTGEYVGVRESKKKHELFVYPVNGSPTSQLTKPPEFPGYVDNIGGMVFGQPSVLCFFGGDKKRSKVILDEEIGASDMYAADVTLSAAQPLLSNITRTNGHSNPPFKRVASLRFAEIFVGPLGQRIHIIGDAEPEGTKHAFFDVLGSPGPLANAYGEDQRLTTAPELAGSPAGLLALATDLDVFPLSELSCSGDVADVPTVRILATDDSNPHDSNPRVWFDGIVNLGEQYTLDAVNGGETSLKDKTYVHVFDLNGDLLQTAAIETKCDIPLYLWERFGASVVVDYVGEYERPDETYDYCSWGTEPRELVVTYNGADCSATSHSQASSKVSCSGDTQLTPLIEVLATDKSDYEDTSAKIWFQGQVPIGESFVIDADLEQENKLKNETFVHAFTTSGAWLQSVEFSTSCDEPLYDGDTFGAFTLNYCILDQGPVLGDCCASGDPSEITLEYVGTPCSPIPLSPELRLLEASSTDYRALNPDEGPFSVDTVLTRLVAGRGIAMAAFVATSPSGLEHVYQVDLESLETREAFVGESVCDQLCITEAGRLVFAGDDGTGWHLYEVDRSGSLARRPLAGPSQPLIP